MRSSIARTEKRYDTHIARLRPRPRPSLEIIEPEQLEGGRKGIGALKSQSSYERELVIVLGGGKANYNRARNLDRTRAR